MDLEVRDEAVIVHVSGEVDLVTVPVVDEQLTEAVRVAPPAPVVLDMTNVVFLASAGLSLLIKHARGCAEAGTSLRVVAADRAVLRAIDITGLAGTMTVVSTVEEALTAT